MTDWWNKLIEKIGIKGLAKSMLDHNRYVLLGIVCVLVIGGCAWMQPRVPSFHDPKTLITRWQVDAEVRAFELWREAAYKGLEAQEEFASTAVNWAGGTLMGLVGEPWTTAATAGFGVLAAMFGVQSAKKSKRIGELETKVKAKK